MVDHVVTRAAERQFVADTTRADHDERGVEPGSHLHQDVGGAAVDQLGAPTQLAIAGEHGTPLDAQQPFEIVAMALGGHMTTLDHRHHPDRVEHGQVEVEATGELAGQRQCALRIGGSVDADDHRTRTDDAGGGAVRVGHRLDPRVDVVTTLQFLGATGTVTGSRFLVRTERAAVLVDAGLFQGTKRDRLANWEPFPVDPTTLDAVVVTHAHIDHSGWLPGLVRDGFTGPIFATDATCELCAILLPDAAHLQEEEARFANERGFSKHRPARPLYTSEDADAAVALLRGVPFDRAIEVADGIVARFVPAGHILGSASVHLTITDRDNSALDTSTLDAGTLDASSSSVSTLLISGDLGRGNHPLIPGPATPPAAQTVLVESTYGDSMHPPEAAEIEEFAGVVSRTAKRGGIVLIPAFAVDRTEVLLIVLRDLMAAGRIPPLPVYVDSPMALRVLGVYRAAMSAADPLECHAMPADPSADLFDPGGGLHECPTVEDSKSLNELTAPAIIISASGMATGGRVLHHLARLLPDHRNSVVLCGFQAAGTRGRSLIDGARSIKMLGRYVPVRAEVDVLRSLSVHADADGLHDWISSLPAVPDTVFVVHGEPAASAALANRLVDDDVNAVVPTQFEVVRLD